MPFISGVSSQFAPWIRTKKTKIFAGGSANVDFVVSQTYTRSNSQSQSAVNISHPAVGYQGTIEFYLAGLGGDAPAFYPPDGYGGTSGSGEQGRWIYAALGDETSFTLQGFNPGNSTTGYLQLTISGGARNGQYLRVGSHPASGSYGHGGAPQSQVSASNLVSRTLTHNGAARMGNSTISYSDATSYGPYNYASYGSGSTSWTVGGATLTMGMSSPASGGGLVRSGVVMGRSGNFNQDSGFTDYPGGVIINFKND